MEVEHYDEIEEIHRDARNAFSPLVLGNCAFLRANGTTYRTSAVVAIHEQSADMIHFETLNSDYYLSMDPFPMAAVFPAYTALAACA